MAACFSLMRWCLCPGIKLNHKSILYIQQHAAFRFWALTQTHQNFKSVVGFLFLFFSEIQII